MSNPDITLLLDDLAGGQEEAVERLIPVLYDELRRLAASAIGSGSRDLTLRPTALVHEAFIKLVGQRHTTWQNRAHFFAVAATVMRRIIVDEARRRQALKRGGGNAVTLDANLSESTSEIVEVLGVNEALEKLTDIDERQAKVVEMRFFAGLTIDETAEVLGVSGMTVKRDWVMARAWLHRELSLA